MVVKKGGLGRGLDALITPPKNTSTPNKGSESKKIK